MSAKCVFIDYPIFQHKNLENVITSLENMKISNKHSYSVLSIDVGVVHLGLSVSLLDDEYNLIEIIWIDLIDITEFTHSKDRGHEWGESEKDCKLYHTKTFCDWLNHTFQENYDFFEKTDFILVERQPPMGFVVIEQLIFSRWRHKTILISPSSMHKYFNINSFDYENRKSYTDKIALKSMNEYIEDKELLKQLTYYDRTHDISDSICIMLYWINLKQKELIKKKKREKIMKRQLDLKNNGFKMTMEEWFNNHSYIK